MALVRMLQSSRRNLPSLSAMMVRQQSTAVPQVEVEVDGKKVQVAANSAVIRACEAAGVEIPRFCYHERLAIAGNCRMCLVEMEKSPKPIASCAMPVAPGMKIKTNTPLVKKAREGVMELLLANHPLDCPICDQGGECDLQDQSMVYGSDRSRFREPAGKRAVEDKNFGPLIATSMNRCIHCTRCVRFATEVAGAQELGSSGRGGDMEIGTYVEQVIKSELSGNVIDLCPVGALTSKPYSFTARPWELRRVESIDVHDAIGANIRVDARGQAVMRVLPRVNDDVNEEWLADKSRFSYDGLKRQRLLAPLIREGNKFVQTSWEEAFSKVGEVLSKTPGNQMKAIAGQMADLESLVALKDLFNRLGSSNLHFEGEAALPAYGADIRSNYLLNEGIANIEKATSLLLIGTNPRHEAPLFNARIRKSFVHFGLDIGLIGAPVDLSYSYDHLGNSLQALEDLVRGKNTSAFAKKFLESERPQIVIGADALARPDGAQLLGLVEELSKKQGRLSQNGWHGVSVLHRAAARVGALDVGFVPGPHASSGAPSVLFLLAADALSPRDIPRDAFVIYLGHHGDVGANYADVVLPGAAYTEKSGTYVNTEGRVQRTRAAVSPPGNAREDWKVIRALSEILGLTLPYDSLRDLRARLLQIAPHLGHVDTLERASAAPASLSLAHVGLSTAASAAAAAAAAPGGAFVPAIKDYYLSDPISRASQTMAKCSAAFALSNAAPQVASA